MEIPDQKRAVDKTGVLLPLVRSLATCVTDRECERLKTSFYNLIAPIFYDRLKKIASKLYRGIPDWEGRAEEVFNDTFEIAFEELRNFEIGSNWDDRECERVILHWMGKIANNLLLQLTRKTKVERGVLKAYKGVHKFDLLSGSEQPRKSVKLTYDKEKLDKFWAKLNPMSKEILLACSELGTVRDESGEFLSDQELELLKLRNYLGSSAVPKELKKFIDKGNFEQSNTEHLPDDVQEYLMNKYKVKQAAIRKAKQRALEGLRNCKL